LPEEIESGAGISLVGVVGRALFSTASAGTNGPAATLFNRLKRPPPQRPPSLVVVSAMASLVFDSSILGELCDCVSDMPRPLIWPRDQVEPGDVICVDGVTGDIDRFSSL